MKTHFLICLVAVGLLDASAVPFTVARRGMGTGAYVVVRENALPAERYAAVELTNYVYRMTGVRLPVVSDVAALPVRAVVLGATRHTPSEALPQAEPSGDAFRLSVKGGRLFVGGAKRGVLYGVYELLERFGGCRWYASWCEKIPECDSFEIPDGFVDEQRPAFLMREPFWYDVNKHRDFAARIRVNGYNHTPNDVDAKFGGDDYRFGGGLPSCHTFNRLCDPEVYFDAHPEYFSLIKGKRQKDHTQLCLTNPDVLRIVTSNVLARISRDPTAKFYGVSQNDWYNYCECPACRAIDDEEESHAGTMVRFVNAVAEEVEKEFPDAIVETLAYQYTRKPPKKTKLRHNVVPCLCTIECDFSRPLTESRYRENVDFLKDIVGWSAQTERLYVWDYVTNFRRYTMPHANFDALQGNVKCFRDNGVKYLFEQGDSLGRHADFAELKAWLLAKWMWNPDLPAEPLLEDFFEGYYGAAAPQVRAWFEELRAAQRAWSDDPDRPLCIYERSDYAALSDVLLARGAELLAKGAEAVRGDAVRAHNVRMCAFSIDCMRLDRMRKLIGYDLWLSDEPFDRTVWTRACELAKCLVRTLDEVPHIRLAESVSNADMNDAWRAMATNMPPVYAIGARAGTVGASRFEGNNPACKKAIVPCAGTKDGTALAFFETPWDWCGRYYLEGCRLRQGAGCRLRVRAKVEKATGEVAFVAGVRINDLGEEKVDRLVREIQTSETSSDWKWYDVGTCVPGAGDFVFVGHAPEVTKGGRTAEQRILVDCVEISVEPEPMETTAISHMDSVTSDPYRDPGVFGEYWWANRFLSRHRLVEQYKGKTVDVVMLGDSIVHFWERFHPESWGKLIQGRQVLNLGYGGDQTQHVIWRLTHGELDGYTAKAVVLMIGTNNNSSDKTDPANVAEGVKRIIRLVREKQPQAKIILHPIFPRGVSSESKYHAAARARNDKTNAILKDFAAKDGKLVWVDFNARFLDANGWVPTALMADEIHPTDAGYELWLEALKGRL